MVFSVPMFMRLGSNSTIRQRQDNGLFNFWLQGFKFWRIKKVYQRDVQAITNLFDGQDFWVLALAV